MSRRRSRSREIAAQQLFEKKAKTKKKEKDTNTNTNTNTSTKTMTMTRRSLRELDVTVVNITMAKNYSYTAGTDASGSVDDYFSWTGDGSLAVDYGYAFHFSLRMLFRFVWKWDSWFTYNTNEAEFEILFKLYGGYALDAHFNVSVAGHFEAELNKMLEWNTGSKVYFVGFVPIEFRPYIRLQATLDTIPIAVAAGVGCHYGESFAVGYHYHRIAKTNTLADEPIQLRTQDANNGCQPYLDIPQEDDVVCAVVLGFTVRPNITIGVSFYHMVDVYLRGLIEIPFAITIGEMDGPDCGYADGYDMCSLSAMKASVVFAAVFDLYMGLAVNIPWILRSLVPSSLGGRLAGTQWRILGPVEIFEVKIDPCWDLNAVLPALDTWIRARCCNPDDTYTASPSALPASTPAPATPQLSCESTKYGTIATYTTPIDERYVAFLFQATGTDMYIDACTRETVRQWPFSDDTFMEVYDMNGTLVAADSYAALRFCGGISDLYISAASAYVVTGDWYVLYFGSSSSADIVDNAADIGSFSIAMSCGAQIRVSDISCGSFVTGSIQAHVRQIYYFVSNGEDVYFDPCQWNTTYDTYLYLLDMNGVVLAFADDDATLRFCGALGDLFVGSDVMQTGTMYQFVVGGYDDRFGDYQIQMSCGTQIKSNLIQCGATVADYLMPLEMHKYYFYGAGEPMYFDPCTSGTALNLDTVLYVFRINDINGSESQIRVAWSDDDAYLHDCGLRADLVVGGELLTVGELFYFGIGSYASGNNSYTHGAFEVDVRCGDDIPVNRIECNSTLRGVITVDPFLFGVFVFFVVQQEWDDIYFRVYTNDSNDVADDVLYLSVYAYADDDETVATTAVPVLRLSLLNYTDSQQNYTDVWIDSADLRANTTYSVDVASLFYFEDVHFEVRMQCGSNIEVVLPTAVPTYVPTNLPTNLPTGAPTHTLPDIPTTVPSNAPTDFPTGVPTNMPTRVPTDETGVPTRDPTMEPTTMPPTTVPPTTVPSMDISVKKQATKGKGRCNSFVFGICDGIAFDILLLAAIVLVLVAVVGIAVYCCVRRCRCCKPEWYQPWRTAQSRQAIEMISGDMDDDFHISPRTFGSN